MKVNCSDYKLLFEVSQTPEYLIKIGLLPASQKLLCGNCEYKKT